MTVFVRTPEVNFSKLVDFNYSPDYHTWQNLRMHYVDAGPKDAPVALLLHGMPTWGYLYRHVIPVLLEGGYRCIAPDHIGFGRSDKPTDIDWYSIERHTEILTSFILALDLKRITMVCQDWGGPIGLAQAAMLPDRFEHLVIMNTWLHHEGYEYSDGAKEWKSNWLAGGSFSVKKPDLGLLMLLANKLTSPGQFRQMFDGKGPKNLSRAAVGVYTAYLSPFHGLPDEAYNGARRFPLSLPIDNAHVGNAAAQSLHFRTLLKWDKKCQFIWGCQDKVFTAQWGRHWAKQMNARFDGIAEAGHFLQDTHGKQVAQLILDGRV
ncbi:MAG: alpha/beta fold hydrolase [Pseudomonadota bacterium]